VDDAKKIAEWVKDGRSDKEVPFRPARILLQDFTGVPAVVDLAAMRDALLGLGGDPRKVNPLVPVDLVIDHSVMVDVSGTASSLKQNVDIEFERNGERYEFLRWGQEAFNNFRVVPPGTGICHQVNLEYLAQTVWTSKTGRTNVAYPEARRVGYTRQDLTRAARLLDEAGWTLGSGGKVRARNGKPLKFSLIWWGEGKPTAELMQAQWAKVGAQVEVLGSPDYGLLDSIRSSGNWDIFVEGWGTDGDPESVLSRHVAADGDLNYMKYNDAVMADLLKGFETLTDAEDRRVQALHINQRHADTVPFIPISSRARLNAVSTKVHGYVPHFQWWQYEVHSDLWVSS
jgi:hypothetical protein